LTGGVAHDFNNLLTAIRGYSDLAVAKTEPGSQLHKDLREIQIASERAMGLTRQLLLFSRRQPMEFLPIDLNQTIENLFGMLRRIIGEDIKLHHELASESLFVSADQTSIEQMIMNLVVNARDAMLEGGTITIKTKACLLDRHSVKTMPDARTGRFIRFSVADTGMGMDSETQKRMFEPFFSTKDFGKGSGLGLAVVLGIVQQHKGWIRVLSQVGQGSLFEVYLPIASERPAPAAERDATPESFFGKGERILVIEDEGGVRYFAQKALSRNGYTVFTASNEKEAIEAFKGEKGDFQLVFSDVVLPGMNGIQLIEKLLSLNPKVKVLLTSGYTDQKSQWRIIKRKGYPFLQKPYSLYTLLKTIRECIAKPA
jgi:two-component system cell cycle sensor histidine kinase/response regulator CckA